MRKPLDIVSAPDITGPRFIRLRKPFGKVRARRRAPDGYFAPVGCSEVITSRPVWAQKAPLVPMAMFEALGQPFQ